MIIFLALFFTLIAGNDHGNDGDESRKVLEVEQEELGNQWHVWSVKALLKAKAMNVYRDLPIIEKIVYEECIRGVKQLGALAVCVVRLLNERNRRKEYSLSLFKPSKPSLLKKILIQRRVLIALQRSNTTPRISFRKPTHRLSAEQWIERRRGKRSVNSLNPIDKFDVDRILRKAPKIANTYFRALMNNRAGFSSKNLENLRRLRNHFLKVDVCNEYLKMVNTENQEVLERFNLKSRTPTLRKDEAIFNSVMSMINKFTGHHLNEEKFSILSPSIFSIFPESQSQKHRPHFFSPNLLSFHRDGVFSMNDILKAATGTETSKHILLDAILEASGASEVLDEVLGKMKNEIREMNEVRYPLVQKMSRLDLAHLRAHQSLKVDQRKELDTKGYTFFEREQLEHLHGSGSDFLNGTSNDDMSAYLAMNKDEKEALLEKEIRQMAKLYEDQEAGASKRSKRQVESLQSVYVGDVEFITFKPMPFTNFINKGLALKVVTLSPSFWVFEFAAPQALNVFTLSPRAFVAAILSPNALIARTLSPIAFRADVLSPRALNSWVLSPTVFVAKVLTPRFLEPKVLSPEAMVIDVLSPGILSPNYMSDKFMGLVILSPSILSPKFHSEGKMLVEILSPAILGGSTAPQDPSAMARCRPNFGCL
ncbi:unnamed protein product, partial [Mesorhabditis belari]|uniref:Uncharacterized protein n=1 Tax=Mesorhabditis belari TaxID=2138241 RepID=A0AAF3ES56_9BILA